jgi:hypothetical protein
MADPASQYSQNNSIDTKVFVDSSIQKVKDGLGNISDAVSSSVGGAVLKLKSAWSAKDLPKSPQMAAKDTKTPEEKKVVSKTSKFSGALVYPQEIKYYTVFSFKAYRRTTIGEAAKDISTATIVLPMPSNLAETFGVEYETPELGAFIGSAAGSFIGGARQAQGGDGGDADTQREKTFSATAGAAAGAVGLRGAKAVGEAVGAGGIGAAAAMAAGAVPNPHMAVIFKNINLREHKFSYKFAPNSESELAVLKSIIKQFKTRMLPGMAQGQDILFSFPDVCDITFGPLDNSPYRIKRCVLQSLDINYAPNGPAFFKTGDPVMVEISMSFKEMSAFTREDIKD